jgi:anti-sigma factor RsiW
MSHSNHDYDCDQALPLLARYRDGELPEDAAGRLRRHLMDCPDCRREASEHRNLSRWFKHGLPSGAPAGFAAKVASLAQVGVASDGSVSGGGSSFEIEPAAPRGDRFGAAEPAPFARLEERVMLAVAAAAVALIGLAVALGWQQQPASDGLQAESLPLVLEELKALNEAAEQEAADGNANEANDESTDQ